MKKWLLAPAALLIAGALAVPALSAGHPKAEKVDKAGRDTPAVMKDIKEGKAQKVKSEKHTTGVWDGCQFYLPQDRQVRVPVR
jgi:hypothetical protein